MISDTILFIVGAAISVGWFLATYLELNKAEKGLNEIEDELHSLEDEIDKKH